MFEILYIFMSFYVINGTVNILSVGDVEKFYLENVLYAERRIACILYILLFIRAAFYLRLID